MVIESLGLLFLDPDKFDDTHDSSNRTRKLGTDSRLPGKRRCNFSLAGRYASPGISLIFRSQSQKPSSQTIQ